MVFWAVSQSVSSARRWRGMQCCPPPTYPLHSRWVSTCPAAGSLSVVRDQNKPWILNNLNKKKLPLRQRWHGNYSSKTPASGPQPATEVSRLHCSASITLGQAPQHASPMYSSVAAPKCTSTYQFPRAQCRRCRVRQPAACRHRSQPALQLPSATTPRSARGAAA